MEKQNKDKRKSTNQPRGEGPCLEKEGELRGMMNSAPKADRHCTFMCIHENSSALTKLTPAFTEIWLPLSLQGTILSKGY